MGKNYSKSMPKEGQNEVAMQNATKERDYILYDFETPLVINEEDKILRIYVKEKEEYVEEIVGSDDEDENDKSLDYIDIEDDGEAEEDEFSYDEYRNREFNHYEDSMEDVEDETSFRDNQYREVRIVFADKASSFQASNKTKYSIDIFTSLSLEELEQRLLECDCEDDIIELQGE